MKILHIVESLDLGGLERVVVALARYQKTQGHEVRIGCLFRKGSLADEAETAGIKVFQCDKATGVVIQVFRQLRKEVRAFLPEVIHSHNAMSQYYAVVAGLCLGKFVHINTRHGMGNGYPARRMDALYRLSSLKTRFSVAVCETARRSFVDRRVFSASKSRVVRNGIDLAPYATTDRFERQRKGLRIDPEAASPWVFGTVGRLSAAKNHELLISAFARLSVDYPAARLVIVGEGGTRKSLENLVAALGISDHVDLLGERSDIPELLSAMDVFVLSSVTEGYSLALVEACASGLAIICTKVGGNEEIVIHEKSGLVVKSNDCAELAEVMKRMASSPSMIESYGRAARTWALEEGSLAAMYDSYLGLYVKGDVTSL